MSTHRPHHAIKYFYAIEYDHCPPRLVSTGGKNPTWYWSGDIKVFTRKKDREVWRRVRPNHRHTFSLQNAPRGWGTRDLEFARMYRLNPPTWK